jgi:gliding motility-associated-like protein
MEKETFESVLKEKLGNHELPVNPALWKSVSAQAGLSSGGAGLGFGAWIGIASSLVAITAGLFYFTTSKKDVANVSAKKQEVKTTVNEPVKTDKNVINSNGGKAYALVEPDTTEHIIYCGFGTVVDEKPIDILDLPTHEFVYLQDNQEQTSTEISTPGLSALQNTSNTALISKKENAIEQTLEKPQAKAFVMPNAITPNGDGINDVLTLNAEGLTDFNVVVLDAANKLVYSSTDPNFKWNGSLLNGDPAPAGTYQYYFTAKDENGTLCNQFSSLTILR